MAPVAKILTFFFLIYIIQELFQMWSKKTVLFQMSLLGFMKKNGKKKFLLKIRKRAENIPHCQCRDPGLTPQDPGTSTKLLKTFPKLSKLLTSYPILL